MDMNEYNEFFSSDVSFRKKMEYNRCKFVFARNAVLIEIHSFMHGKNDFAEGLKILLDTDLKIILLEP